MLLLLRHLSDFTDQESLKWEIAETIVHVQASDELGASVLKNTLRSFRIRFNDVRVTKGRSHDTADVRASRGTPGSRRDNSPAWAGKFLDACCGQLVRSRISDDSILSAVSS
jgi:hypothetical protein